MRGPAGRSAKPRRRRQAASGVLGLCSLAPRVPAPGYRHPVELPRKECARSREEPLGGARDGTHGPAARCIGLAPPSATHRRGSGMREDRQAMATPIDLIDRNSCKHDGERLTDLTGVMAYFVRDAAHDSCEIAEFGN